MNCKYNFLQTMFGDYLYDIKDFFNIILHGAANTDEGYLCSKYL